ncbi:hypothetical protein Tco_0963402, partial [Tanacetum coccineum]
RIGLAGGDGDNTGTGDDTGSGGDGIGGSGGEGIWGSGEDHGESGDDGGVDIARSLATSTSDHTVETLIVGFIDHLPHGMKKLNVLLCLLTLKCLMKIFLDDLLQAVPELISRIDSLKTDLKQTKLTMGNAIVKLVKKVKKLEGFLERRNMVLSDSEEEEPKA